LGRLREAACFINDDLRTAAPRHENEVLHRMVNNANRTRSQVCAAEKIDLLKVAVQDRGAIVHRICKLRSIMIGARMNPTELVELRRQNYLPARHIILIYPAG